MTEIKEVEREFEAMGRHISEDERVLVDSMVFRWENGSLEMLLQTKLEVDSWSQTVVEYLTFSGEGRNIGLCKKPTT